ncbi:MAG: DUF1080 domain-containing protein [Acidobacteriota bacterium]|nr:MAG: DUF1080 domain-containing protein [Acidobacteriota bacterium]
MFKRPVRLELPASILRGACVFALVLAPLLACSAEQVEDGSGEIPGWISLFDGKTLEGWKITDFGGQGKVQVKGSAIAMDFGNDMTGITWAGEFPTNNFEIALEAMQVDGTDFFCGLTFPVDDDYCSLIVGGWGGSIVGLSSIDDMDASENETSRSMRLWRGRWYRIRLAVVGRHIRAWIDDEMVVDIDTTGGKLGVRPEVRLSRPLGFASWQTRAALRKIRYRVIDVLP